MQFVVGEQSNHARGLRGDVADCLQVAIHAIANQLGHAAGHGLYWRRAMPYPAAVDTRVLQQNAGRQAAILNLVRRARATLGDSSVAAMNNGPAWKRLVREVAEVVRIMPLWKTPDGRA